jgi:hypothetical protein
VSGSSVVCWGWVDGILLTDIPAAKTPVRSRNLRRVINENPHLKQHKSTGQRDEALCPVQKSQRNCYLVTSPVDVSRMYGVVSGFFQSNMEFSLPASVSNEPTIR